MVKVNIFKLHRKPIIFFLSITVLLAILSSANYLLFHFTVELFTIFIGIMIFLLAVNSTSYSKKTIMLVLGVAYLYVGVLDFLHALSFEGMGIIPTSINISNQYWIGARFIESANMIVIFAFYRYHFKAKYLVSHLVNLSLVIIFVLAISQEWLPAFYIEGTGQTNIKIILATIIIIFYLGALFFVYKSGMAKQNKFIVFVLITFKILSEIMFTQYTSTHESFTIIGHLLKFLSYGGLYIIFISEMIRNPYQNIYRLFQNKEEELRVLSEKDSLTGLYNHSLTFRKIEEMIEQIGHGFESVTVVLIDIDDFKLVNDTYGHQVGDEVLVNFSELLLSFKLPNRIVGRYGGDEFVIAALNINEEDVKKRYKLLCNNLVDMIRNMKIDITFSAGVATYEPGDTAKSLVYKADIKMYESKRKGKNQITIWQNELK